MVHLPRPSGDSQGFHRESDEDATKIKLEPGMGASAEGVTPQKLPSEAGYTQNAKEEGPDTDLEEKPRSFGSPFGRSGGTSRKNLIHKHPSASRDATKRKKTKSARRQLKAPDSDTEDRGDQQWTIHDLAQTFYTKDLFSFLLGDLVIKILSPTLFGELQGPTMEPAETPRQLEAATQLLRMLKDIGTTPGAFNASEPFDLETSVIQRSTRILYETLEPLVGSVTQPETVKLTPPRNTEYQTGSSQYASATSEAESDSSADLQRMTLGPSGEEMLRDRQANDKPDGSSHEPTSMVAPPMTSMSPEQMQTFFNAAMSRYLKETQTEGLTPAGRHTTANQDVEMESVGSRHGSHGENDSDNLSIDTLRQAVIASLCTLDDDATYTSVGDLGAEGILRQRSRRGSREELAGQSEVRTSSQLEPSVESINEEQLEELTQYYGQGVSGARQYYHAKKRSDESPLEYLHRLNVAGLRAKLQPHVEHFIETLDDRDLADQLALLRSGGDTTGAKTRQGKTHVGTNKFRQKAAPEPPSASSKKARTVRAIRVAEDGSESESDVSTSDQEDKCRRVYLAEAKDRENHSITPTHRDGSANHLIMSQKNRTHCG
ncbi:LOW QUALITY PROTEIN: hypothetical protein PHMEG_00026791 [Phytophthora megakarya]|uniref:Uncharacterized protein n=1 Tax=Phytophthora megakarya TaxID=4795 RepID=A0A225VBC2_9STRA|nr:LOW QUALITY PROTEIN: hypothetical protein PHMEG_00026791 [Phytophthora megakarya]